MTVLGSPSWRVESMNGCEQLAILGYLPASTAEQSLNKRRRARRVSHVDNMASFLCSGDFTTIADHSAFVAMKMDVT